MDGYVIARLKPGEAEDIFALPQVRHVAELADGNTFIAFDGDLPYEGGTVFEFEAGAQALLFPLVPKIRSKIDSDATEYLGLYSAAGLQAAAGRLSTWPSVQLALVAPDLALVLAFSPLPGYPIWESKSERIWDKRLEGASA